MHWPPCRSASTAASEPPRCRARTSRPRVNFLRGEVNSICARENPPARQPRSVGPGPDGRGAGRGSDTDNNVRPRSETYTIRGRDLGGVTAMPPRLERPPKVTLGITEACPLRCRHCYADCASSPKPGRTHRRPMDRSHRPPRRGRRHPDLCRRWRRGSRCTRWSRRCGMPSATHPATEAVARPRLPPWSARLASAMPRRSPSWPERSGLAQGRRTWPCRCGGAC